MRTGLNTSRQEGLQNDAVLFDVLGSPQGVRVFGGIFPHPGLLPLQGAKVVQLTSLESFGGGRAIAGVDLNKIQKESGGKRQLAAVNGRIK